MIGLAVLERLLDANLFVPMLIAGSIVTIVVIKTIVGMVVGIQREKSRREIAAYIAEGSMTPEQGERLMKAGESAQRSC